MSTKNDWALILGASSGFGGATAVELAKAGFHIFGVHLDRKATMPLVEEVIQKIQAVGKQAIFFNMNAADEQKRREALDKMQAEMAQNGPDASIRVLMHSLAFGSLTLYVADDPAKEVDKAKMEMTLDVMANSLVYWTQDLMRRKMMRSGGRIFAMTSSGGTRVWPNYGPVSAAKAALESHIRQLALELAPFGITANSIRAGVTDTPALRKIPGNEKMIEVAKERNPSGRLTTPEDVAKVIALLTDERAQWITGNVIGVDGGEDIVG
ncbi:MAG: SDR family oxidoreductase [candidate division KSB1 bacterium]|nr:SDR family oxidoreductase [candidate division KSB1 bacterium]MDZ7300636.1 SDR family oxidoreductase [candidate division KSB1 bacterium]MDZ7309773.1 SDR family oxidoreductase [candidate division KSB1 bacterium]